MKKFMLVLAATAVFSGLLAGCGSPSSRDRGSPVPGISESEYEEARQAVIDADREWRDENLF